MDGFVLILYGFVLVAFDITSVRTKKTVGWLSEEISLVVLFCILLLILIFNGWIC